MEHGNTFQQWCIVELFGRTVIVGMVTEQTIGGTAFIRVDVPEVKGQAAFTRFYGQGAIYAMTPVSEEAARLALKHHRPEPINVYAPEFRQLAASATIEPEDDELDDFPEGYDPDNPDYPGDEDEPPF